LTEGDGRRLAPNKDAAESAEFSGRGIGAGKLLVTTGSSVLEGEKVTDSDLEPRPKRIDLMLGGIRTGFIALTVM
jgi:hypothetical protein